KLKKMPMLKTPDSISVPVRCFAYDYYVLRAALLQLAFFDVPHCSAASPGCVFPARLRQAKEYKGVLQKN
ncbi:MAG: hypothetical protein IJV12_04755, partial [Acidaminococcaceae bacterium]|nr:hypothetical protein [Acidaminococcaceae bacterium]